MAFPVLAQLQEIARTNDALRLALDAATTSTDLVALAAQYNLQLDAAEAQSWLEHQGSSVPSSDTLASLAQGLSGSDAEDQILTEAALEAIAGGGLPGEAALGEAGLVGEAI